MPTALGPQGVGVQGAALYPLDSARGLGTNQIHRLAMDQASRLWLATPMGLSCFDGSFVDSWDRSRGLQCNGLRSVGVDAQGTVWIGTDLGLEMLDAAGRPGSLDSPLDWSFGLCQHIDASGHSPWIGAAHGIVRVEPDETGRGFRVAFNAEVGFVSDIRRLDETRVLAASAEHGLIETNSREWWRYRCAGLPSRGVTRLARGRSGSILVGTDDGLYLVDDAGRAVIAHWMGAEAEPAVTAIAAAPDLYWVAFGRALIAYEPQSELGPGPRVVESYWLDSPVNDLLLDPLGNVWAATNNSGLAQVSCLRHALERIDLGHSGGVYSIRPGGDDEYLIGGENLLGSAVIDSRPGSSMEGPKGLPPTTVWDAIEDETGIWAATQSGLFHAPPGGVFSRTPVSSENLGAPARVLMRRGDDVWVGTLRGLTRLHQGGQSRVNDPEGNPLGYVYALHEDDRQRLWVATLGRGLWREEEGRLMPLVTTPLTVNGNTYAVAAGANGSHVVLQDDKVLVTNADDSVRLVARLPPVAGWSAVPVDATTIAIGASDGLRILDLETGRMTTRVRSLFPRRDWEFTNSRALVRDPRGRFLCGVNGGLLRVDLSLLRPFLNPPVCRLVDLVWHGVEPERDGNALVVRAGRWSVRARAFAAWFVDHTQLTYQFQLIGFDTEWSAERDRPETTYTSLPPGTYRLLVRASSPLTGFGPPVELAAITVRRPWWTMGWVAALSVADSTYDRVVRAKARNDVLIEANRALEDAVEQRTSSLRAAKKELETLRDAYKQLSEIDELTGLGNRRKFDLELGRGLALANRLNLALSLMMLDIDYFKAVNDRQGHQVGDEYLAAIGRVLAAAVRKGEDVATRFGGEEFALLLSNTGTAGAQILAERIRADIEALRLPNSGSPNEIVTVSIGIATLDPGAAPGADTLVGRADRALYRAKQAGRNRVIAEG